MQAWGRWAMAAAILWRAASAACAPADQTDPPWDFAPAYGICQQPDPEAFGEGYGGLRPQWVVRGGAVLLQRSTPRAGALITDQPSPGGTVLLDAADFRFSVEGGPDFRLIRFGPSLDWEVRYFGVNHWSRSLGPILSPQGAVARFASPVGNTAFPVEVSAACESELQNFEVNLGRAHGHAFRWLAGFRYVELDERGLALLMDVGPGLNQAVIQADTVSRLYGFQLGAEGVLWGGGRRLRLEGAVKAGVYFNSIHTAASLQQEIGPNLAVAATQEHPAFVGEVGLLAVYQLSPRLGFSAGYQLLWLEGVAEVTQQVPLMDLIGGQAGVDTTGSPFYHGATVAIQLVW